MKRIACVLCVGAILLTMAKFVTATPLLPHSPTLPLPLSDAPPTAPVKLIFIHHSTGGNWLADPNDSQPWGGLGKALMKNNYFVSATNYGWGPDGIGDRTDIPNWPEWFVGPNRDVYLNALYNESGQNVGDFGDWSRLARDPGGENVIIMFKSCFPNSDLYGNPDDPPLAEPNDYDYTVANAKAVYNALLGYFETRQDKLFVVITAPPLLKSDTSRDRAANARAFNNWLVNDWLADYPYANVAVFDYYNVLTAPANHHRWNGSEIEHILATNNNFSAYPSGDSHPSTEGHTKATTEFVPLLNVFYNRWQAAGPVAPPPPAEPATVEATEVAPEPTIKPSVGSSGLIDDFEGDLEWYADPGDNATITCDTDGNAHGGAAALRMTYSIPANSWGGCGRYYDATQDWSAGDGLTLWLRTDTPGLWTTLTLYSGPADAATPFEFGFEVTTDWNSIFIPWTDFARASWADEGGLTTLDPTRINNIALSLGEGKGNLWVDDVARYSGATPPSEPPASEQPTEAPTIEKRPTEAQPSEPTPEPTEAPRGRGGLCASAPLALMLLAVGLVRERSMRNAK
ncbi:MAG TPA: carbohydrate binding domain-containing protein [Anaerolineae bacterium]|nr:carbohydrate binding domain-containing protein [Anaerolineae bacterium]HQI84186.1 carbohydrate binding domain-containing protein [Anaerolineae bacterium]